MKHFRKNSPLISADFVTLIGADKNEKKGDGSFSKRIKVIFLNTAENPPGPLEISQKVNGGVTSISVVPTGLWVFGASIPSDESLGYYHKSLRDKAFA